MNKRTAARHMCCMRAARCTRKSRPFLAQARARARIQTHTHARTRHACNMRVHSVSTVAGGMPERDSSARN
eukprot:577249-Alexandrium_andersonii.AAC.1